MKRRTFITTSVAALSVAPSAFAMGKTVAYRPGMVRELLAEGKTVFVDYTTDWCGTCRTQRRRVEALREANPAYDENIVFVSVDYDKYGDHRVTTSRNIPRRSTLIVLKGKKELGRVVARTSEADIKDLLDTALNAATSA